MSGGLRDSGASSRENGGHPAQPVGKPLDASFVAALTKQLKGLPSVEERNNRHDSWMTSEQIARWWGEPGAAQPIEEFLLKAWRDGRLSDIRPAKYPALSNLFRLWGHVNNVGQLDRAELVPQRADWPQTLPDLGLPANAPTVFLSISSMESTEHILGIRKFLGNRGFRPWFYGEDIDKDDIIFEEVRAAIMRSRAIIVSLTAYSLGSAWIHTECHTARCYGLPAIVLIDATDFDVLELARSRTGQQPAVQESGDGRALERLRAKFMLREKQQHRIDNYLTTASFLMNELQNYAHLVLYPSTPAALVGDSEFLDASKCDFHALLHEDLRTSRST